MLLDLARERGPEKSFCPSEAARRLVEQDPELGSDWRGWMEPTRQAAQELEQQGLLDFLQKGQRIQAWGYRGPIRLRASHRAKEETNDVEKEWSRKAD